jgi:hypothetical protein
MNKTDTQLPKVNLATEHYVREIMAQNRHEIADAMREQTAAIHNTMRQQTLQIVLSLVGIGVAIIVALSGLARGLAARREQGGLATDVVPADDLTLIWSPDRTHARALRSDGTDALTLVVAGAPQPFEVHVGRLRGAWTILR